MHQRATLLPIHVQLDDLLAFSKLEQASARCPRKFHFGRQMSVWWGEHVLKSHIDNYNGDDDVVDDDGDDDVEQCEQDEI